MATEAKWSDFTSQDGARTLAAANQLLPPWVALLIVIAIGWQLANIIWMLIPGPAAGDAVVVPTGQVFSGRSDPATADVQAIAAVHLFGEAGADEPAPVVAEEYDEDLEDTRLSNLELKGTLASPEPAMSAAIIADGRSEEKVYLIGDPVASNAKLHAVYTDRVVLNENGRLTNLRLPEEYKQVAIDVLDEIPGPQAKSGELAPVTTRVYPVPLLLSIDEVGRRPDHVGQSLTDPTQAMEIFQSLGTSSQVSVTVERNGQPEVIVLKTDQLNLGEDETE
jgi:general secretion pathway protein C